MDQVLTANRLRAGEVVYWNKAKGWVSNLAEADVLGEDDGKAALALAQEAIKKREVVGAYLFDVKKNGAAIVPVKEREVIRARGPSVRPDLGKQAN